MQNRINGYLNRFIFGDNVQKGIIENKINAFIPADFREKASRINYIPVSFSLQLIQRKNRWMNGIRRFEKMITGWMSQKIVGWKQGVLGTECENKKKIKKKIFYHTRIFFFLQKSA